LNSAVVSHQSFKEWTRQELDRCEAALNHWLPANTDVPNRLHEAMRYAATGGGKRVRPLLVFAAAQAAGAIRTQDALAAQEVAACSVEMIHAYSLVHDDLPCMDDDDLRRGRPTVHRQFDEATAMLVGDGLQARAFELLSLLPNDAVRPALAELGLAAGSFGMVGGQAIDLASVGQAISREQLEQMHQRKTGALLKASVRLGWICARGSAPVPTDFDVYADAIGLAFQVVDDILDVEADSATLGKTAGKDAAANKPTYVSIIGLESSRELASELHRKAIDAIVPYGADAQRLRDIAELIVLRKH